MNMTNAATRADLLDIMNDTPEGQILSTVGQCAVEGPISKGLTLVLTDIVKDCRREDAGYVIQRSAAGYRWIWLEPNAPPEYAGVWFERLAGALRAAAVNLCPEHGVVVDDERERYCTFPSLEGAQRAADRWNQEPLWEFDPPMVWRSTVTGQKLAPESTDRSQQLQDGGDAAREDAGPDEDQVDRRAVMLSPGGVTDAFDQVQAPPRHDLGSARSGAQMREVACGETPQAVQTDHGQDNRSGDKSADEPEHARTLATSADAPPADDDPRPHERSL